MSDLLKIQDAVELVQQAKQLKKRVVLATGVFDLFHQEHRLFLDKAKQAGDWLIVGVESDRRVREMKGEGRPVQPERERLKQVQEYTSVDCGFLLPELFSNQKDWENLMASVSPAIYAVSSHTSHLENKQRICAMVGCELRVVHHHNPEISTTQLLNARR